MAAQPADRQYWQNTVLACRAVLPACPRRADVKDTIPDGPIAGFTKLVALAMATYADPNGRNVFPGVARLARELNAGERTVKRHMGYLVDLGLIVPVTRGGSRLQTATSYRLTVPDEILEWIEVAGPDEGTGATQTAPVAPGTGAAQTARDPLPPNGNSGHPVQELGPLGTELGPNQPGTGAAQEAHHHMTNPLPKIDHASAPAKKTLLDITTYLERLEPEDRMRWEMQASADLGPSAAQPDLWRRAYNLAQSAETRVA